MRKFLIGLALGLAPQPLLAQAEPQAPATAKAEDIGTVDGIIAALYDVISGDAGVKRDWDRFRSLFYPGAQMVPTGKSKTGEVRVRRSNPEDYIAGAPRLEAAGFHEREIGRRVDTFGPVTHVFSAYEATHLVEGKRETMRGINSIQLFHDGKRYWVLNMTWSNETPDNPIPAQYLTKPN